ncbi:MAG TPA: hypothetical protein G4O02_01745 [Caldilineae bacterium]|jgi:hypothetical protein|nr:hypothetical protein [Caldilineae bacterium]
MSKRIEHILEVLEEIYKNYEPYGGVGQIQRLRREADRRVARRHGVTYRTVQDKYRRRLSPDIEGVRQFEILVEQWLLGQSDTLQQILLSHAVDAEDESRIRQFFEREGPDSERSERCELPSGDQAFDGSDSEDDVADALTRVISLVDAELSRLLNNMKGAIEGQEKEAQDYDALGTFAQCGKLLHQFRENIEKAREDWIEIRRIMEKTR